MVRKMALIFAVVTFLFLLWAFFGPTGAVSITINGQEITSPLDAVVGIWGVILAAIVLFCVAILLAFVFAGVGLIVLGVLALVGLILTGVALPFLLPLLLPLFIVWVFCSIVCRLAGGKSAK